jgi:hypothetical protein
VLALVVALLGLPPAAGAQVTLATYDVFTAPLISPDRWIGLETSSGPAVSNGEIQRRVVNGQAQLLLRATGAAFSDTGAFSGTNRLRVGHRALLRGTPRITAMEAHMKVVAASIEACPTNSEVSSRARAQVFGVFFNDGTGNANTGDRTGDVSAGVQKVLDSVGGFRVEAFVQRCADPNCFVTQGVVTSGTNFTRSWAVGDTDRMRLVWNRSANTFVFTVDKTAGPSAHGSETVTLGYTVPDSAPAKRWFNDFVQASTMANCTGGAVTAFMDLRIDRVLLNSEAVAATLP